MSGLYAATRQRMVGGTFAWAASSFAAYMIGAGYTPDYEAHATLADVLLAQRVAGPFALTSLVASAGYCGAANLIFTNLTTSAPASGILITETAGGVGEGNKLVAYIDQGTGLGATFTAEPAAVYFDARGLFRA